MNYVPLILAITIMTKNPKDYGLEGIDLDRPLEYDTLDMKTATNLDLIGDVTGRPVSEMRELNPALLSRVAPARFQLHVPKGSVTSVSAALEMIPAAHRDSWRMHRVEPGETLAGIANRFRTPAAAIASANGRTVEGPEAGDLLIIPSSTVAAHAVHRSTRYAPRKTVASAVPATRAPSPRHCPHVEDGRGEPAGPVSPIEILTRRVAFTRADFARAGIAPVSSASRSFSAPSFRCHYDK